MGSSGVSWKLADHPKLPKGKTVAVVVLDGWGEAKPDQYNCIHVAETPTMDSLKKEATLDGPLLPPRNGSYLAEAWGNLNFLTSSSGIVSFLAWALNLVQDELGSLDSLAP